MLKNLIKEKEQLTRVAIKFNTMSATYENSRESRILQIERLSGDMREQALFIFHTEFEPRRLRIKELIKKINAYNYYLFEQMESLSRSNERILTTKELINCYVYEGNGDALCSLRIEKKVALTLPCHLMAMIVKNLCA